MSVEQVMDALAAGLVVLATLIMSLGAVGALRMPDVYTRVQAASKTSTLGLATLFLGAAIHFGELAATARALAVVAFAFLSVPIAAHMIVRAAYAAGVRPPGEMEDDLEREQR